jgi:hypothetical protein
MSLRARNPWQAARALPIATLVVAGLLAACQTDAERGTTGPAPELPPAPSSEVPAAAYLEALDDMAAGDVARQQATLLAARSAWQQAATPGNTLRYALVLGTPGHDDSNPLEASRLLNTLLATPGQLSPDELRLASAFQREFTARVSQYADLARARLEAEARLRAVDAETQSQINAMAADLARVRRERDTIQQKLDAIADIEKTLMERDDDATSPADSTPP